MNWSDAAHIRIPFKARINGLIVKHQVGEEWMLGKLCDVVEIFRRETTPMALCELDYGLDIGVRLIALPIETLDPGAPQALDTPIDPVLRAGARPPIFKPGYSRHIKRPLSDSRPDVTLADDIDRMLNDTGQ